MPLWPYPRGTADDMIRTSHVPRHLARVIYNPVITPQIAPLASEPVDHPWFASGEPPVVLGMGRLTTQKDFPTLLQAAAQLRRDREFRLLILGEGEDHDQLERLIRELGLTHVASLTGFVKNPFAYLARASLFVLSSAWEALPTVLIEALALGTPVVSTDCQSGPREILDGGRYGRLVPVGDVHALSQAMAETLAVPRTRVPAEALRAYTLEFAVDRYCQLMAEVMSA
jgi:glycosyltransferase involved in cell wall biosynthesis